MQKVKKYNYASVADKYDIQTVKNIM